MKLVEKVSEGSVVEINYTGTGVVFKPGILKGGVVEHDCDLTKPIGYYLLPLVYVAPFSKLAFKLTLLGITTCQDGGKECSVDILRTIDVPLLRHYGMECAENIELKIIRRGSAPLGGGQVYFTCPIIKSSAPFSLIDEGKVLKIRGISTTTRISPQVANRLVESARSVLNQFVADIFVYSDVFKGKESGNSPGFNLSLVAETTKGCFYFAECDGKANEVPEDIGVAVAKKLLNKIKLGGCFDVDRQATTLLMMAMGPEDLFKTRFAPLTLNTKTFMIDLQTFLGVTFKVKQLRDENALLISTIGSGFVNLGKKIQ